MASYQEFWACVNAPAVVKNDRSEISRPSHYCPPQPDHFLPYLWTKLILETPL